MRFVVRDPGVFTATYDLLARVFLGRLEMEGLGGAARELRSGGSGPQWLPGLTSLLEALGAIDPQWPAAVELLLAGDHEQAGSSETERAICGAPLRGRYVPPYASVYLGSGGLGNVPRQGSGLPGAGREERE